MSRDHTEIIYAHNIHSWIDEQLFLIEAQREQWKSETVQAVLHAKAELLSAISEKVQEWELTVAKDSIVKAEPGVY